MHSETDDTLSFHDFISPLGPMVTRGSDWAFGGRERVQMECRHPEVSTLTKLELPEVTRFVPALPNHLGPNECPIRIVGNCFIGKIDLYHMNVIRQSSFSRLCKGI